MAIIRTHQHGKTPGEVARGTLVDTRPLYLFHIISMTIAALALAAALGLGIMLAAGSARPDQPIAAAPPRGVDPSRFILNALLAPALDADAVPLRWVDPRPALRCGPDARVRVNREPLLAGALVPDTPFELEWQADGCRPFGLPGPRFDGGVKLTVFREDWGFSAMVEPSGLRVASPENQITLIRPGAASMPQSGDTGGSVVLAAD